MVGEATPEMRDRFTRVLRGHIAIARAVFPDGTTGAQLDSFARQYLWQAGLDFEHGTGHGVGSYLSVHVDFAAHFAGRRNVAALQCVRNILDGADVGGDVLAGKTVATGCRADQFAVLVTQRQRQAVDLRFGNQHRDMFGIELEKPPDTIDKLGHILVAEGIAERQHG